MGVAGRGQDLEDAVFDREERDVESSTTEVVYDNLGLGAAGAVETVGCVGGQGVSRRFKGAEPAAELTNRSGGRLVDNTEHGQTCDGAGILGGLPLGVVEVCGAAGISMTSVHTDPPSTHTQER